MTDQLQAALDRLSPTQRQAADWKEGAALVLAGPGVGKTTVLTARIAFSHSRAALHDEGGRRDAGTR